MSIKKILGIILLATPFAGVFAVLGLSHGWQSVVFVFILVLLVLLMIGVGTYLLASDE